jgi:hypothetical protein
MPVKVTGINELKRILKGADIKIRMAANSEIHKIATDILNESKALVPFDKGILHGSGHLVAGGGGSKLVMSQTVEYGGPAAPYALIQHEGVNPRTGRLYFHPSKAHGGMGPGNPGHTRSRKYLEIPAKKHQATVVPRLIAAIKRVT